MWTRPCWPLPSSRPHGGHRSRDATVRVVQATEDWQGPHAPPARGLALRHASWRGDLLLNALMWALLVEVRDIGPQGTPEVGLPPRSAHGPGTRGERCQGISRRARSSGVRDRLCAGS